MNKYYDIRNKQDGVEILLYGDIAHDEWGKWTQEDTCPGDIVKALKEAGGKPLTVRINSGGGSVFGGMAIYNVLKGYAGKKTVYVDGIAASIASVIMLAGDEIYVPKNAYVMIHKPWGSVWGGSAKDMRAYADSLDVCEKGMMAVYSDHLAAGETLEHVQELVDDETWMTGEEAAKIFTVTAGAPTEAVACAGEALDHYGSAPKGVKRARDEPEQKNKPQQPDNSALDLARAFCFVQKERSETHE